MSFLGRHHEELARRFSLGDRAARFDELDYRTELTGSPGGISQDGALSSSQPRLTWVPKFTAGFAGAVGAEMALALLVYLRGGLVGALTLVLCVEMAALAAGFWFAPRDTAPPWSGIRQAWFLLVFAYVGAAAVAASWETLEGLSATWISRGMGLAFLGAMPLYGIGLVLGATDLEEDGPSPPTRASAALGAAVGFAFVGLGRANLETAPASYVTAVLVVSAGAFHQARLLAAKEIRWREWAERGAARDEVALPAPRGVATPVPDALRARPEPPIAPGTLR